MNKINIIPFEEYSALIKEGADKCEYLSWKVENTKQWFHVVNIDGEIFVPNKFAEMILELLFATP